jgi:ketosteroid isomerase-like protein
MSYQDKAREIYNLLAQGKALEAFEKYYHNDVAVIEARGDSRKGKDVNRKFQIEFLNSVQEFHAFGVTGLTSDEKAGITMVESWMDMTLKDGKRTKMEEVAVQRWKGDQIIHERFYYNIPK